MISASSPRREFFRAQAAAALTAEVKLEPASKIDDNPAQRSRDLHSGASSRPRYSRRLREDWQEYLDFCSLEGREPRYRSIEEYAEAV